MSDLDTFTSMLDRAKVNYHVYDLRVQRPEKDKDWLAEDSVKQFNEFRPNVAPVVLVVKLHSGYRCHAEAYFDDQNNMLDLGSYEEM